MMFVIFKFKHRNPLLKVQLPEKVYDLALFHFCFCGSAAQLGPRLPCF